MSFPVISSEFHAPIADHINAIFRITTVQASVGAISTNVAHCTFLLR